MPTTRLMGFASLNPSYGSNRTNAPRLILPPHQRSLERGAVDFLASDIHGGDAAGVADVVEGIVVEHQQVGALVGRDDAAVVETEELSGAAGSSDDDLGGRHAGVRHHLEFLLLGEAERMVFEAGVAAEDDPGAGLGELG